jgi:hypothetical protein
LAIASPAKSSSAHSEEMQDDQHNCDQKNDVYQRANGLLENQKSEQPENKQHAPNDQQHS